VPQDRPVPGSASDWMARAQGDLALAKSPLPENGFYEDLCYHCQQAAEKAIKAVYQHKGWTFRYTHDLDDLLTGLNRKGVNIPQDVEEAAVLTDFAWETRYPGVHEPVTEEEYEEALCQAEQVLAWAQQMISG
jgi:HEPN domain-containing protein